MGIKGTSQTLYVSKKESNIVTFLGNKKQIVYTELSRIDYMHASGIEAGYIEFVRFGNNIIRFEFGKRANEEIVKTINLIKENNPDLNINEHSPAEFKFYQHSLFAILISFILGFPLGTIGLFLIWHYKKSTTFGRILITIMSVLFWSLWVVIPYIEYRIAMNELNNTMDSYYNILNGFKWN